ncbi:MAG TPA: hypothetical protein V6D15_00040 [Oculatellaceae cyanobacterium]|jgi:very-short-patch-repair endonuclease
MANFPIILYPQPVKEFLQAVADSSQKTPQTRPPALHYQSVIDDAEVRNFTSIGLLQVAIAINFILLTLSIFLFPQITILIAIILCISCVYTLLTALEKRKHFYIATSSNLQEQQLEEYEKHIVKYNKAIEEYAITKYHRSLIIVTARQKLAEILSKQTIHPFGYSEAQQGASEAKFKIYLDKYFPNKIHQGFQLIIPNYNHPYSADFTYVEKSLNLHIDIEIDEVYYYKTKKPTHCCDDNNEKIRNAFFLSINWVVIRFAEEQVVCYPKRCCKAIATLVSIITGERELFDKFKDVPDLPLIKHWSTKDARRLAKINYRDKLLK